MVRDFGISINPESVYRTTSFFISYEFYTDTYLGDYSLLLIRSFIYYFNVQVKMVVFLKSL